MCVDFQDFSQNVGMSEKNMLRFAVKMHFFENLIKLFHIFSSKIIIAGVLWSQWIIIIEIKYIDHLLYTIHMILADIPLQYAI